MSRQQEKINLNQELKRCVTYLKERETELPSHLKQSDMSVLSTQEQVKLVQNRLTEIAKEEYQEKEVQKKLERASADKLQKFKSKLYKFRTEISEVIPTLQAREKAYFFELENILNQKLRNYQPPKGKK